MRSVKKIKDWQKDKEPQFEFPQTHEMVARRLKDGKIFASDGYKEFVEDGFEVDICKVNIGEDFWAVIDVFQPDMIRIAFTVYKGNLLTKIPAHLCPINDFESWIYGSVFLDELKKENP
jgi:hypothetical protein